MPVLSPQKPLSTAEPRLLVENKFAAGVYRFGLVVVDDSGNESIQATIAVTVGRTVVTDTGTTGILSPSVIGRVIRQPLTGTVTGPEATPAPRPITRRTIIPRRPS